MSEDTLYAKRDAEALGEFYLRHVDAMTREGLHAKSAIAAELAHRDATIATLRAEIASLKTVMVAAAEEIAAHWQAHCDAEGYGPQNLVRRLEEGIPSEYGYTAGAFATLRAEVEGLRADAERYRWLRLNPRECADAADDALYIHKKQRPELFDAAIDAAKADKEGA